VGGLPEETLCEMMLRVICFLVIPPNNLRICPGVVLNSGAFAFANKYTVIAVAKQPSIFWDSKKCPKQDKTKNVSQIQLKRFVSLAVFKPS
jgi:hypothetical protein